MKIAVASTLLPGQFGPMLAAAELLAAQGHDVVVTAPPHYASRVRAIGARLHRQDAHPPGGEADLRSFSQRYPERALLPPGPTRQRFDFERIILAPLAAQHAALDELLEREDPALLIHDDLYGGALPLLLGTRQGGRPRVAAIGTTIMPLPRADGAPLGLGLPPAQTTAQCDLYGRLRRAADDSLHLPLQKAALTILAGLGARPLPLPLLESIVTLPDFHLQVGVPGFELPRAPHGRMPRFLGSLPRPATGGLPTRLASLRQPGRHLILVTQGTLSNLDQGQLIEPAIAALADLPHSTVLVATGGVRPGVVPAELPANVRIEHELPFDAVMPYVDVLVTNGGYGGVMQALSQGVPIVCAGLSESKAEVALCVADSGAGIDLMTDTPSTALLRAAVEELLYDCSYRLRALELSREFARHDADQMLSRLPELVRLMALRSAA